MKILQSSAPIEFGKQIETILVNTVIVDLYEIGVGYFCDLTHHFRIHFLTNIFDRYFIKYFDCKGFFCGDIFHTIYSPEATASYFFL